MFALLLGSPTYIACMCFHNENLHAGDEYYLIDMLYGGLAMPLCHVDCLVKAGGKLSQVAVQWRGTIVGNIQVRKHTMDMHTRLLACKYKLNYIILSRLEANCRR